MTHRLLDDPYVAEQIEAALRPYVGELGEDQLAWMRDRLAGLLAEEPDARELLSQAHPRGEVDVSGERLRPGLSEDTDSEGTKEETG